MQRNKKLMTKQTIQQVSREHATGDPRIADLAWMAEQYRQIARNTKKRPGKRRRAKEQLNPTDYLSPAQFAQIIDYLQEQADQARLGGRNIGRAVRAEMLITLMAETGLRVSEVCQLKVKDVPTFHGQSVIHVRDGKGGKTRTVSICREFREQLEEYVRNFHGIDPNIKNYLFKPEAGGGLSRQAIYAKVKRIGLKVGLWVYTEGGKRRTKLSPHKFRHTCATNQLAATGNVIGVKDKLGHSRIETVSLYAKSVDEARAADDEAAHQRLWSKTKRQRQ